MDYDRLKRDFSLSLSISQKTFQVRKTLIFIFPFFFLDGQIGL
jgi:hypothetical protein